MNTIQSPSVKTRFPLPNTRFPLPNTRFPILIFLLFCSLFSLQCKKDLTTANSSAKLSFSTNVLFFDTVFATGTVGSSVRVFLVHNNSSEAVVVSSIRLAGSFTSPFQINVDGVASSNVTNIKIPANDSIYVFAQINAFPSSQNNPIIIQDSLVFVTNGNIQSVKLEAYGWNAHYYKPNIFPKYGPAYYAVPPNTTWNNQLPYVILGYLADTSGTLTIQAGTHVYMHDSAVLDVFPRATLNVMGTAANPVIFQGDRLEPQYNNLPGQWGEIFLGPGSINNNISWAVIENGTTGIQVDTVANSNPTLRMDHTIIKTMSGYGILAEGATIAANNCLIADCQYSCLFLWIGGSYQFDQCTFADYWGVDNSYGQRSSPLLYINNYYQSNTGAVIQRPVTKAFFGNCIVYGALDEEVKLDSLTTPVFPEVLSYYFENCIIKTKQAFSGHSIQCYINQDPLFVNPAIDNYEVSPGSPAIGNGNASIATQYSPDLNNTPTSTNTIGAYQQ